MDTVTTPVLIKFTSRHRQGHVALLRLCHVPRIGDEVVLSCSLRGRQVVRMFRVVRVIWDLQAGATSHATSHAGDLGCSQCVDVILDPLVSDEECANAASC